MNGLHDLLDKLKKLEEAATAPTTFRPNYYHKSNFGTTTPLMMTDPGVFWHMSQATNDDGGTVRGGGKTIQQWYGNTENRSAINPASVDGKMVNGKPGPEFPEGVTWKTDLAITNKATADAQQAQQAQQAKATADANTAAKAAKVKQFTDLLVKAGVYTAPAASTASSGPSIGTYSLSQPGTGAVNGIKLPAIKSGVQEGIVFKSRIGQLLVDSGALQGLTVSNTLKSLTEASALTKAEYSLLSKLYGELKVEYPDDAQLVPLLMAYDKVAPVYSSDPAAQTATVAGASSGNAGTANNASSAMVAADTRGSQTTLAQTKADVVKQITAPAAVSPAPAAAVSPTSGVDTVANATVPGSIAAANQAAPAAEKKPAAVLPQAVQDLAATNKIDNADKISVGQVITLPDGTKYTIVKGDTLADIAAGKFKGVDPTKKLGTDSAAKVAPTATYPTDAKAPVNPRPTDNVMAQQVWDSKYASGWNPDGSAKTLGTDSAAKATTAQQLDPRGNPLVKDKDGNLGYYNNPNVPSKGFTIVVPATTSGDAAKEARKPRYDTVEKFDKEIARFSSKYDMKLKLNQQYIEILQAEKAQLVNPSATATGNTANSDRPGLDPKKGKPEVYDRQKQLAALGAKMKDGVTPLGLDGVNGNDTIAAEKEFGRLIVDPKTTIVVNGAPRVVNANDIKSIQSWIKAVKDGRQKMDQVPAVYMDIVKKQSAMKESTGYTNDELNRLISLVHHR